MKRPFDTRPRWGHNHAPSIREPSFSKITYVAHAKGYVMARRPAARRRIDVDLDRQSRIIAEKDAEIERLQRALAAERDKLTAKMEARALAAESSRDAAVEALNAIRAVANNDGNADQRSCQRAIFIADATAAILPRAKTAREDGDLGQPSSQPEKGT